MPGVHCFLERGQADWANASGEGGIHGWSELHGRVMGPEEPRRCFFLQPFDSLVYHHYSCCFKYALEVVSFFPFVSLEWVFYGRTHRYLVANSLAFSQFVSRRN